MTKIVSVGEGDTDQCAVPPSDVAPEPLDPSARVVPTLSWSVTLTSKAERNLKKGLQPAEKEAVNEVLRKLEIDPFSAGLEPLNHDDRWKWKGEGEARGVRIVLDISQDAREVRVQQIDHRGSIRYPGGRGRR